MPYVDQKTRNLLEPLEREIMSWAWAIKGPGTLNYLISILIREYLHGRRPTNYADYNEVLGVLEGVKLELFRRQIVPYEDIKIEVHGDVY